MIKLDAHFVTTATTVMEGVTTTNITDTLRIAYVELDLNSGSVMAMLDRGTLVNGVFVTNQPKLRIQLNSDGTFASTDGAWTGTVPVGAVQGFLALLAGAFQSFVLGAGAVTGTQV
jgi:hypothetical protein